jgi:hypothetical protein
MQRFVCALLCLAWVGLAHAADGCDALNGTYQYQSVAPRNGIPEYLSNFVQGVAKHKLMKTDHSGGPKGLGGGGTMARPKTTHLATTATLTHSPGGNKLKFLDAEGKALVEMEADFGGKWTCKGARLERRNDRAAGLGNVLRTERVEEVLSKDAGTGDLLYTETITVVEPPGKGAPTKSEARFKLARATG